MAWQAGEGALEAQTIGINASSTDAATGLIMSAPAMLLTHEGAGH